MSLLFGRCTHTWQGMSYADIAGLPFVAGLYADFSPLIIYAFFGSSRQIAVGPVAIISLLVYQSIPLCNKLCAENSGVNATEPIPAAYGKCPGKCTATQTLVYNPEYWSFASSLALLVGIINVIASPLLQMVMSFVPHALMAGFCSGAAIIIALSQMTNIMGYKVNKDNLQKGLGDLFGNLANTHGITITMGTSLSPRSVCYLHICISPHSVCYLHIYVSYWGSYHHIHLNTSSLFA